jgi:hypothetical protein
MPYKSMIGFAVPRTLTHGACMSLSTARATVITHPNMRFWIGLIEHLTKELFNIS